MSSTTPNKETIRRLCLLHEASYCYLEVNTNTEYANILIDLENNKLHGFLEEVELWCGMKFKLFNPNSKSTDIKRIKAQGEKIYPL